MLNKMTTQVGLFYVSLVGVIVILDVLTRVS